MKKILFLILAIIFISCNSSQPDKSVSSDGAKLLFFLNPDGQPCQMQLSIINEIRDKIEAKASIVLHSTLDSNARNEFYKYGIRMLPSLILVDKDGKELKRFSPGIKSSTEILEVLKN